MSNDIGILVFSKKLFRTTESHLIQVFVNFFFCHTYTTIWMLTVGRKF